MCKYVACSVYAVNGTAVVVAASVAVDSGKTTTTTPSPSAGPLSPESVSLPLITTQSVTSSFAIKTTSQAKKEQEESHLSCCNSFSIAFFFIRWEWTTPPAITSAINTLTRRLNRSAMHRARLRCATAVRCPCPSSSTSSTTTSSSTAWYFGGGPSSS